VKIGKEGVTKSIALEVRMGIWDFLEAIDGLRAKQRRRRKRVWQMEKK